MRLWSPPRPSRTATSPPGSVDRLHRLDEELANAEEELRALEARWEAEKQGLNRVGELKKEIDELRSAADRALREGDLVKASEISYGTIPALEKEMEAAAAAETELPSMVSEQVGPQDVAEVVANWTGIPTGRLLQGETEKLLSMEERIGERLIGQRRAVRAVSDAVRRSRAGISDPNRPTGSFLFLGPTGVGKTELAKSLAEVLFGDDDMMVRLDMSEFQERHTVSRLVGAPPGYVGYEEAGQLTEAIRRKPYSVVLLDEIEKAHADVFNLLLQILDDGRLTDAQGRTVDFKNCVVIMTSNLGADRIQAHARRKESFVELRDDLMQLLRAHFRPEFLNRIDEIIVFRALTRDQVVDITRLMLDRVTRRLRAQRIEVAFTDEAIGHLANAGFDPEFGARPLQRTIQRLVENRLSRMVLDGSLQEGDAVTVDLQDGRLDFDVVRKVGEADGIQRASASTP